MNMKRFPPSALCSKRRESNGSDFQCKTEEDVIRQAAGCDGLIVQYAPITARVIAALERCRVIVRYGIGVDNVDVAAATAKGIFVCNVPDYGVEDVANHAFAFLLALAKKIPQQQAQMHSGGWAMRKSSRLPA